MKRITFFLILVLVAFSQIATAQTFEWAKQLGGTDQELVKSITVDGVGNVYSTGFFRGTADFDPEAGIYNLIAESDNDGFISKLDALGNFVWAKQIGGTGSVSGNSIVVDTIGNIYITGQFSGTTDFDPGLSTFNLTSSGNTDIFVCKLDAWGDFVWARQFGGTAYDAANSIAIDADGSVYITGYFESTVDFDPGDETYNLTSEGWYDIFISKIDTSGDFVWAIRMGGTGYEEGTSIAVDNSGNIYTTGYYSGTADFDPGIGLLNLTAAGNGDIFISKLDSNSNLVWAESMGGTCSDRGTSIAIDISENVYITGCFCGTSDFDPSANSYNLTSAGENDIFISKLDASGDFIWAKQFGGTTNDEGYSIQLDSLKNVYSTGVFSATADFDPSIETVYLNSQGGYDTYISKLDSLGNFIWVKQLTGSFFVEGHAIFVDNNNNVYTAGYFESTADLDPSTNTFELTSIGYFDIFVHKISQCLYYGTDVQIACNSYAWIDGYIYTESNNTATYNIVGGAANGCDSLVTLNLTINNISDVSTSLVGNEITANNNIATYQWLDCNNSFSVIDGETNQSFTPIINGSYAVELTEDGCVEISDCVTVTTVEFVENTFGKQISVFPNPTNGQLTIAFEHEQLNVQIIVINTLGQEMYNLDYSSISNIDLKLNLPAGIYFIEIVDDKNRTLLKVLKE